MWPLAWLEWPWCSDQTGDDPVHKKYSSCLTLWGASAAPDNPRSAPPASLPTPDEMPAYILRAGSQGHHHTVAQRQLHTYRHAYKMRVKLRNADISMHHEFWAFVQVQNTSLQVKNTSLREFGCPAK